MRVALTNAKHLVACREAWFQRGGELLQRVLCCWRVVETVSHWVQSRVNFGFLAWT
jgi:hypothetical protein